MQIFLRELGSSRPFSGNVGILNFRGVISGNDEQLFQHVAGKLALFRVCTALIWGP